MKITARALFGLCAVILAMALAGCGANYAEDEFPVIRPTSSSPSPTPEAGDPYGLDAVNSDLDTVERGTNQADIDVTDGDTASEQDDGQ